MLIDAHCDTALILLEENSLRTLPAAAVDFARLNQTLDVAFTAIFFNGKKQRNPERTALILADRLLRDIEENSDIVCPLLCREQLLEGDCRTKLVLSLEGAELLGCDGELLALWHRLGLRSLGLTWNYRNDLASGCYEQGGLSKAGADVIKQCNELGIIVDLAHLAPEGFWQALDICQKPPLVSHAACYRLTKHCRNLDDERLRAIGKAGGVVGITFVDEFLSAKGKAGICHFLRHLNHCLEQAGTDGVAIGSDFDGAKMARGLESIECWANIPKILADDGFTETEIAKICGDNLYRVLWNNLPKIR